jgi:AAA domain
MGSCCRPGIMNSRSISSGSSSAVRRLTATAPCLTSTLTTCPLLSLFSSENSNNTSRRSFSAGGVGSAGTGVKTGHYQRPIFVAATRQHVGKTTVSLAMMSGLKKRFNKVGFIKPVGQQHVKVQRSKKNTENSINNNKDGAGDDLRVDKDVCLIKEHFRLDHLE